MSVAIPHDGLTTLCRRHHIRKLMLFGSVLRDDFGPNSDIDVLVEFEPGARVGYIKLVTIQNELAELLDREVDLLTPGALNPRFRQKVINAAQVVYERAG